MRRLDEQRAAAFESSPLEIQRREIVALIKQEVGREVDEPIGELLRSLEPDAVARLRTRLDGAAKAAPAEDEAGDGRPEGDDAR